MQAASSLSMAIVLWLLPFANAEEANPAEDTKPPTTDIGTREELKLPGMTIHTKEHFVDVDATICLAEGFLELIACTKDSKEHESIIAVDAKPSHMHAALLLLRAKPGSPAEARELKGGGLMEIAPSGSEVNVSLVIKDEKGEMKEHPISEFIFRGKKGEENDPNAAEKTPEVKIRFPTSTFIFAGSQLYKGKDGTAKYLSDESGNVISLSTFGDELLCLPGKHSQKNAELSWEIDPTHLPAVGTKVILRLRPKQAELEQATPALENPKTKP